MDFIEEIRNLSARITKQKDNVLTEEATKNAFVLPFIKLLGYDVSDVAEVVPEFTADVGTKQGEKVDYAIFKDGEAIMLIECKKYGADLTDAHTSQLYRYFSVVHARIAVLTDGVLYRFYTDLEKSNIMDTKPFLEFDMLDIQPPLVNVLKQFSKSAFDLEAILTAASDLKYTKEIKQMMMEQLESPSEEFVKFFLSSVYSRSKTQAVVQQFTDIVKCALNQFLNEQINQRLQMKEEEFNSRMVTIEEELEGFYTVKSIIREVVAPDRVFHRDTKSYMLVFLDDNKHRLICRLYFNRAQKYLTLPDEEKNHERVNIERIDDIYQYAEQLKAIAQRYDAPASNDTPAPIPSESAEE